MQMHHVLFRCERERYGSRDRNFHPPRGNSSSFHVWYFDPIRNLHFSWRNGSSFLYNLGEISLEISLLRSLVSLEFRTRVSFSFKKGLLKDSFFFFLAQGKDGLGRIKLQHEYCHNERVLIVKELLYTFFDLVLSNFVFIFWFRLERIRKGKRSVEDDSSNFFLVGESWVVESLRRTVKLYDVSYRVIYHSKEKCLKNVFI